MGITISSKNHGCDMGCGGFNRFRNDVAKAVSEKVGEHYADLDKAPFFNGRDEYFEKYDKKTEKLVEQGELKAKVANFLYKSDISGEIDKKQANAIYKLIKDMDDNIKYGYIGRSDCATMKDLKLIFSDGTKVKWY